MSAFLTFQTAPTRPWLAPLLPFLIWWPRVNKNTIRYDFLAGLTGAIVVLPQAVAFATIAGMPPEYGLYAGIVPAFIAALFGSSWHLISGPTTAASLVLFSVLSVRAEPGGAVYVQLAVTLTFMVGIMELVLGLIRMGSLVNFISHSVVIGFTAGAAILIATNQMKNFFGLPIPRGAVFVDTWTFFVTHLSDISPYATLVAGTTLITGILARRFLPRWPYMILALFSGSLVGAGLKMFGISIAMVGAIPATLPPLSAPTFSLETMQSLLGGAVAVTLLALTEAVSIARAMAVRSGQYLDSNQELIGQGLSNIIGSFFSSYVATGSFNRSGLNFTAGAQTPLAAMISSVLLAFIILLVAPLIAYLPNAAMAGVLFLVAWGLIDFHHIRQIIKTSWAEALILGVTFLATLTIDLEKAIVIGVILSLVVYLQRTANPPVRSCVPDATHPQRKFYSGAQRPECPQMKIIRIDGSLFFGAVNAVQAAFMAFPPYQHHVIIIASPINFVDISGANFLAHEAQKRRANGGGLYFVSLKQSVLETLIKGNFIAAIGEQNIFQSKGVALATVFNQLDPSICQRCPLRIFLECGHRPGTVQIPALPMASVAINATEIIQSPSGSLSPA